MKTSRLALVVIAVGLLCVGNAVGQDEQKVVMLLKKRTQDLNNEYPGGIRKPRQELFRNET